MHEGARGAEPELRLRLTLSSIYGKLYRHFGPSGWWPAETPLEMIIGAILTQAVSWTNVEKAMANLKRENLLTVPALNQVEEDLLATLIRPAGYYRAKARKIKAFVEFLVKRYGGSLETLFRKADSASLEALREELLSVYGVGEETADSILLYAGGFPIFVVDAYTRRIGSRLGLFPPEASYREIQDFFMTHLPHSTKLFNEYHALLVGLGKYICRKSRPACSLCPVDRFCTWRIKTADLQTGG